MDSSTLQRLVAKMDAENARNNKQEQPAQALPPPPPYTTNDSDDSDDEDEDASPLPLKLVLNAATVLEGSNNLVPTATSPLADATRFSALLLSSLKALNAATASQRPLQLELTINCGVTIHGDRNVVGNVGLRPKPPVAGAAMAAAAEETAAAAVVVAGSSVVGGAKRKAKDSSSDVHADEPAAKRVATADKLSAGEME